MRPETKSTQFFFFGTSTAGDASGVRMTLTEAEVLPRETSLPETELMCAPHDKRA